MTLIELLINLSVVITGVVTAIIKFGFVPGLIIGTLSFFFALHLIWFFCAISDSFYSKEQLQFKDMVNIVIYIIIFGSILIIETQNILLMHLEYRYLVYFVGMLILFVTEGVILMDPEKMEKEGNSKK
ncbi:hypothetical protein COB57_04935 [Candidatus Peregrinibacteria bacterium]|nr:MAG: hypothetical protein COB57_04935 [Candidatus Peregrinibacteria bacterium]